MRAPDFATAARLLDAAVRDRVCPAAVVEVGRAAGPLWQQASGSLTWDPDAPPATMDTLFDLASLTKVLATASVAMRLVDGRRLALEQPVGHWLAAWRTGDKAGVTVEDLLSHAGGLTGHLPLYRDCTGRQEFEAAIGELPLEYRPRTRSVYSDLGFILLGFILQDAGGVRLDAAAHALFAELQVRPLCFTPPRGWRPAIAPTAFRDWRGRLAHGEVHDDNAFALGGVAGHAGLFGSAPAVGRFARTILQDLEDDRSRLARPATLRRFVAPREGVPGSSRALGWDTMVPTSSCGTRMSPAAFGHTGFTGTSLWIDPARDLYVVLLTNRVYPDAANEALLEVRRTFHDAVVGALAG